MWFVEDALGLQGTCHAAATRNNGRPPCVEAGSTLNFTPRGVKFEILTSTGSILAISFGEKMMEASVEKSWRRAMHAIGR